MSVLNVGAHHAHHYYCQMASKRNHIYDNDYLSCRHPTMCSMIFNILHLSLITFPKEENLGNKKGNPRIIDNNNNNIITGDHIK